MNDLKLDAYVPKRNPPTRRWIMKRLPLWGMLLLASIWILAACGQPVAANHVPTQIPTEADVELPLAAASIRDIALDYIGKSYPKMAPPAGLDWTEERLTPEGLVGSESFQYSAGDWVVTISYPVVAPDATIYRVVVEDKGRGFRWEGQFDAAGRSAQPSSADYAAWNTYTNAGFGYVLRYPSGSAMMEGNGQDSVQFSGPLVDNEHWPCLSVSHPNSDFYRPPAGTDVYQWIADSEMPYDEIEQLQLAGLPAVRLGVEATPQSYACDDYYLIHGEQLFRLQVLHCAGPQDAELYDLFLKSFQFEN